MQGLEIEGFLARVEAVSRRFGIDYRLVPTGFSVQSSSTCREPEVSFCAV